MPSPKTLVIFDDRTRSFRCAGCLGQPLPVPGRVLNDPEEFAQFREHLEAEHADCPSYDSPRLALNARQLKRRIAKEMKKARAVPVAHSPRWVGAAW